MRLNLRSRGGLNFSRRRHRICLLYTSRKAFYLRNGFESSGIFVNVKGCDYELLCLNGKITYEEYQKVLEASMGERLYKKANVRELEPE